MSSSSLSDPTQAFIKPSEQFLELDLPRHHLSPHPDELFVELILAREHRMSEDRYSHSLIALRLSDILGDTCH